MKFSQPLVLGTRKFFSSTKKIFVAGWRIYTMKNKNTKTDYQKVFRLRDQKWEMVKITIGIIFLFFVFFGFFCLRFIFTILDICREFSSSTWKNYPIPKCQFPPKIPIWPKSTLHKAFWKCLNSPLHHPGEMQTMKSLWICQCIFLIAIKL